LKDRERQQVAATDTFEAICEEWLSRRRDTRQNGKPTYRGKLRTAEERLRAFEQLASPELGKKPIDSIKRSDIVRLLDKIADNHAPVMAGRTLAYVREAFNWHASSVGRFPQPDCARHGQDEAETAGPWCHRQFVRDGPMDGPHFLKASMTSAPCRCSIMVSIARRVAIA
jgi:hypothetical protein